MQQSSIQSPAPLLLHDVDWPDRAVTARNTCELREKVKALQVKRYVGAVQMDEA